MKKTLGKYCKYCAYGIEMVKFKLVSFEHYWSKKLSFLANLLLCGTLFFKVRLQYVLDYCLLTHFCYNRNIGRPLFQYGCSKQVLAVAAFLLFSHHALK